MRPRQLDFRLKTLVFHTLIFIIEKKKKGIWQNISLQEAINLVQGQPRETVWLLILILKQPT